MARLRIASVLVQVEAFADDGEALTPVSVQPIKVLFGQWDEFVNGGFDQALDGLRQQVETATAPDPKRLRQTDDGEGMT
jgi:hypothetical protein